MSAEDEVEALFAAIEAGDEETVARWLAAGGSPDVRQGGGRQQVSAMGCAVLGPSSVRSPRPETISIT